MKIKTIYSFLFRYIVANTATKKGYSGKNEIDICRSPYKKYDILSDNVSDNT